MFNDKNSYKELITIDEMKQIYGNMAVHTMQRANEIYNAISESECVKIAVVYEMGRIQGKREERAKKRIIPENGRKIDNLVLEYISKLIEIVLDFEEQEQQTGLKYFGKHEIQEKLYNVLNAL